MKATDPPTASPIDEASSGGQVDRAATLRSVRLQAAVVRELLDELEARTAPSDGEVAAQLAEEVGRLGGELLRASNALRRHLVSERA